MYKVIIVDDEKLLRQGFIHMTDWSQYGIQIIGEASDGLEALELVKQTGPDIVVTDIRMPGMDGIELTRMLRKDYPDIQIIVLSSYNDFEYVKETLQLGALDYILKPKMQYTDLVTALEKAKIKKTEAWQTKIPVRESQTVEKSVLKSLISNQAVSTDAVKEQFSRLGYKLQEDSIGCVLIWLEPPETGDSEEMMETLDLNEIKKSLTMGLEERLQDRCACCCFSAGEKQLLLLFNVSEDGACINQLIEDISKQIRHVNGEGYWLLMSEVFSGFDGIRTAYARLHALSPYRFYKPPGSCLSEQDFPHRAATLDLTLKSFNEPIEKLEIAGLYEHLESSVISKLAQGCYVEPFAIKKGFVEACYYIIHRLEEMRLDIQELHGQKMMYFRNLEESRNLEVCLQHLQHTLEDIQSFVQSRRNVNYHATVRSILEYIQRHYHEDISLQSVAEKFHLNKSYLSQLFKQQTGDNFNAYMAQVRMNKAKELLRQPGHNINKVCEATGFMNPSYFGQVFKKMVGMTPSEYARLYTK